MLSDRPNLLNSRLQPDCDLGLLPIIDLIAKTLGFQIPSQHQDSLRRTLLARIKALGLTSFDDYYAYLVAPQHSPSRAVEWQELIALLSVTESYFFRDQGQFWLLKNQILPELIEQKRQLSLRQWNASKGQPIRPSLRLWSAGCSTGEEAYSLAILLKEIIPDYQEWDLSILGTDINQAAIALAQQGIYSDWSFRTTDSVVKQRYFRSCRKGWQIDPCIREMVNFQSGNLVQDPYPNYRAGISDLDLILCRNVFIYFDPHAIDQVLQKFFHALAPGGFVLTGHTELYGRKIKPLITRTFPQSVAYQRPADDSKPCWWQTEILHPLPSYLNSMPSREARSNAHNLLVGETQPLSPQKTSVETTQSANQAVEQKPQQFQSLCLLAEAHANSGQYTEAVTACQQALQINPLAIAPYYLLAQVSEEQGDLDGAKLFLKRIIYLTSDAIAAYIALGTIYERERNQKQAQKTWRSLLEVLQHLPQEQPIDSNTQQTVAELTLHISTHLQNGEF